MKTKIIATLALAAAAVGLVSTAKAESRVSVNFGISSGPIYTAPAPVYVPAPVVTAPTYGYGYSNNYSYSHSTPRGHFENVTRKVWVPERWVATRNRWGRPVRVLERGHFTYTTERVWVADNHGRGNYGYGYRG